MSNKPLTFIVTGSKTISVFVGSKDYNIAPDHPNFERIKKAIATGDEQGFVALADVPKNLTAFMGGKAEIVNGQVVYNGTPVDAQFTRRVIEVQKAGLPVEPLLRFLENLFKNPSKRAVSELWLFLEEKGLPITDDGCFLGYKSVRLDWKDWHSNKIDNSIGAKIPPMPRSAVDDNWGVDCSEGYHVGAISYVRNFHFHEGHVVIVKVNPADVVTVPSSERTKMRCTVYEVIAEYTGDLVDSPVYSTAPLTAMKGDEGKHSWDDEDEGMFDDDDEVFGDVFDEDEEDDEDDSE